MSRQGWLADAGRRWHLTVIECDGWQTRGSSEFSPRGTVAHHTAGPGGGGDMPSLGTLINGRPDLAGPLCNYGLGRSGTVYVVAAGRANHAGNGGWQGLTGNSSVVGIEAENDGYQPWPAVQVDAYRRLCAAVCEALGVGADMTCRHHEWRSEKPDPHDVDGDFGRDQIARTLAQGPDPGPDPLLQRRRRTVDVVRDPETGRLTAFVIGTDRRLYWAGVAAGGDLARQPFALADPNGRVVSIGATHAGADIIVVGEGEAGADGAQRMWVNRYDAESGSWTGWRENPHAAVLTVP